jgi:hypothetical protein
MRAHLPRTTKESFPLVHVPNITNYMGERVASMAKESSPLACCPNYTSISTVYIPTKTTKSPATIYIVHGWSRVLHIK